MDTNTTTSITPTDNNKNYYCYKYDKYNNKINYDYDDARSPAPGTSTSVCQYSAIEIGVPVLTDPRERDRLLPAHAVHQRTARQAQNGPGNRAARLGCDSDVTRTRLGRSRRRGGRSALYSTDRSCRGSTPRDASACSRMGDVLALEWGTCLLLNRGRASS